MTIPVATAEAALAEGRAGPRPILTLERVTLERAGKRLLDDISFSLMAGLTTIVLGPNGAGKSSLLRLCHGLVPPTSGRIRWDATGPDGRPTRQAFVFQKPVLLRRSALGNVVHALAAAGVPRAERHERARRALERVRLDRIADRPARRLSGGEQQRLCIARAWALRPGILFLDEPTASLDPGATRAIECAVSRMHAEGVRIVMTTHDLGQARRLADEVLFLHSGRLIEHTPAERFFAGPGSPEAAAFLRGDLLD